MQLKGNDQLVSLFVITVETIFIDIYKPYFLSIVESDLLDMCRDKDFYSSGGHLVSPSFPDMYPPDKDCTCVLTAEPPGQVCIFLLSVLNVIHPFYT